MVEDATHPEHLRQVAGQLGPAWSALLARIQGEDGDAAALGTRLSLKWGMHPTEDVNRLLGDEDDARTRLGADRVSAEVCFRSFTGNRVSTLEFRQKDLGTGWDGVVRLLDENAERALLSLNHRTFVYDRLGLREAGDAA
jgi:hypothetical protein